MLASSRKHTNGCATPTHEKCRDFFDTVNTRLVKRREYQTRVGMYTMVTHACVKNMKTSCFSFSALLHPTPPLPDGR